MTAAAAPLIGIVGPTASGKTDLALALAGRLSVEVVVADSRQVYRGMDVGTAKPDAAARAAVPHHLLDLVDADAPFSVADWVSAARAAVADIGERGATPMLVGGTGLFVAALVDGHDYAAQAWAPEIRARLDRELADLGPEAMAERLRRLAPDIAATTDLRNSRRVLRALERAEAGDAVPPAAAPYPGRVELIALDRPREVLYRRIDERARRLFLRDGLLDEVRRLVDAGHGSAGQAMTGHGYAEAVRHLSGELSLEEAIESTARRTRQYAKRQLTWFRRDPRVRWLPAGERSADDPGLVAEAERRLGAAIS